MIAIQIKIERKNNDDDDSDDDDDIETKNI